MTTGTTGRQWAANNLFQAKDGGGGDGAPPPSDPAVWLAGLRLGEAQDLAPYQIHPLCLEEAGPAPQMLLTHQAIEAQVLEIIEEGEGDVQALTARNNGGQPVVVLEGDTLVGCKQNRVVARSVILGKGASVTIPVGCMERGRWAWKTGQFGSGTMRMSPTMRSGTTREILEAKKRRHQHASLNQSRLWDDVDAHMSAERVASPSADFHALIDEKGRDARERAAAFQRQPGQVGVLVMAGGTFLGLELAGHPATWDELAGRTLPAFLLDRRWAAERGKGASERPLRASDWLTRLQQTPLNTTPGLGLGREVDVELDGLGGSGLWHEEQMVHMAVFAC